MSLEANKAVARRYVEVIRAGSLEVLDEVIALDLVNHAAPPEQAGREGLRGFFAMMQAGFPNFEVSLDDLLAEGDKVAMRFTFQGTHQGEFMGIPPSDKPVTMTGIDIFRIADGKIVELWGQEDMLGMMQQLGVVPEA